VRVRTYGFPGCFTRPPGTSTRHHPHEPTMSKPVVPVDAAHSLAAPLRPGGPSCAGPGTKATRSQAALRNPPRCPARGPFSGSGWRGLTPRWPRSLRLGSASGSNLARAFGHCKGHRAMTPHSPRKPFCDGRHSWMKRPSRAGRIRGLEREEMERRDVPAGLPASAAAERKRRGPGPLEEPFPTSGPRAFVRFRWRGLTPRWPRSLRLGSASGCNLARAPRRCKSRAEAKPHSPRKRSSAAPERYETPAASHCDC
jgi:hypothetical protein